MRLILPMLALVFLQGCATLVEGSTQAVSVATEPAGASCTIDRAGHRLGLVGLTPGSLTISKSKDDLVVTCGKDGYQPATLTQPPRFVATTFGNAIAGGLIGVVVDASSGANFAYPTEVSLSLPPAANAPVALAPVSLAPVALAPFALAPVALAPAGPAYAPTAPIPVASRLAAVAPSGPMPSMGDLPPYRPYPASAMSGADPNVAPVRLTGGVIEP